MKKSLSNEINNNLKKLSPNKNYRFKLLLNKWGEISTSIAEYFEDISEKKIIVSDKLVNSQNVFQYFKTTNRKKYDREFRRYQRNGFFDIIFFNEKNQLAEGTRSNIFIRRNGSWYTPSLKSGILPGVYRKYLLQQNRNITEAFISKDELLTADEIILTNSLRRKIKIEKLYLNENEFKLMV